MAEDGVRLERDSVVAVVYPARSIEKHADCASRIEGFCASLAVFAKVERIGRDDFSSELAKRADLVVCIGGDGTTLGVASFVGKTPVLSLRLKEDSVGYLCEDDVSNTGAIMDRLMHGRVRVVQRSRLQLVVNGVCVGKPVANDILISNECPARTTRYVFRHACMEEWHCSSGLWIATARGSHAAARAAGARPLQDDDKRFVLRVREMNHADTPDPMVELVFDPNDAPELVMTMSHIVAFGDGDLWRYPLNIGDHVSFAYAEPLRVVQLPGV